MERQTGARGLRAILEETLLNVMFDVPSQENIAKVIITGDTVRDGAEPEVVQRARPAKRSRSKSA